MSLILILASNCLKYLRNSEEREHTLDISPALSETASEPKCYLEFDNDRLKHILVTLVIPLKIRTQDPGLWTLPVCRIPVCRVFNNTIINY